MKKLISIFSLALAMLAVQPAQADELLNDSQSAVTTEADYELYQRRNVQRSVFLGQAYLNLWRSQIVLNSRTCQQFNRRRDGRVSAIRIQVLGASADIESIMVQFGNGRWDQLNLRARNFRPGQASAWLDLRGGDHCVRRVVIVGDTDNEFFFTRALVRVWARM